MMTTRGTTANPIPSQFNPLIERIARLYLKSNGYEFTGEYEKLLRSQNIRAKRAIAFAIASIRELEEWMMDASGNGLEELGRFIAGEEVNTPQEGEDASTDNLKDFWLQVGDTVEHVKQPGEYGVVRHIDENLIAAYGVTTCRVQWDGLGEDELDVQWTNKLNKITDLEQYHE